MFLIIPPYVNAYEIIYPVLDYKHKKIPNYCIVRPDDPGLNDAQKDWMVKKGEEAVKEWETTLQKSLTHGYKWQIMSTPIQSINQAESFQCDWTVSFQPEIPSLFIFGVVLGYADIENQEIVIRYKKIEPDEFHDILLHEIGHSLGLGHFTTDDNEVMYDWLTSEAPPSIMIPNIHVNPGLTYITEVDIDKLRSIYGTGGFIGKFEKEKEETPIPITTSINLGSLTVYPEKIILKKYQTNMVTISGKLNEGRVLSGVPFYLLVTKPDLVSEVLTVYPTSKGQFQIPLIYDENSQKGTYRIIEGVYLDRTVNFKPINYFVEDENFQVPALEDKIIEKRKNVPDWVKNTARWWSEGIVTDEDFIDGIEYLVQNKIILIPNLEVKTPSITKDVPDWIKNTAKWWANGEISEEEFLKSLEYLVQQGIIRVRT